MFKFIHHQVFDKREFFPYFKGLIFKSRSVKIHVPYLYRRRLEDMWNSLTTAKRHGGCVCLFLLTPQEPITPQEVQKRMEFDDLIGQCVSAGFHVNFRDDIHEKIATIDEFYTNDGSVNFLSTSFTSERANVFKDFAEVQEATIRHRLDECETCLSMLLSIDRLEHLRLVLVMKRKALGWTQDQLARFAGVSRPTIMAYEAGQSISLHAFERLSRALGFVLRCVPKFLSYGLNEQIHRALFEPVKQRTLINSYSSYQDAPDCLQFIGDMIADRREFHLLSQEELAIQSSITRSSISALEKNGKGLGLQALNNLCHPLVLEIVLVPVELCPSLDAYLRNHAAECVQFMQEKKAALNELRAKLTNSRLGRVGKRLRDSREMPGKRSS